MEYRALPKNWSQRLLALIGLSLPAFSAGLQAQVGLSSSVAQVALVAHAEPRGSIQAVGAERETARAAGVRQVSVTLRLSANTGYQLLVRGSGTTGTRVWVGAADGTFQELKAGNAVVVARGSHFDQRERAVQYRIESLEGSDAAEPLPVRYELAINPTM